MRILILDDDAPFAHMLGEGLERLMPDCTATTVNTADEARAAVREADDPFDVFLLDLKLNTSTVDGVTLMEELKNLSPSSDAILFTGYDVEDGLRAFDAGAYRYLTKPFDTRELVSILTVLQKERDTRKERDWLHILTEIASQMQGTDDIHDLASIIVQGGLRFGFRRARLRMLAQVGQETGDDPVMTVVSHIGDPQLDSFEEIRAPLSKLLYSKEAIKAGRPLLFYGRELGPGGNDEIYADHGVTLPQGHWFKIPLRSGDHFVGTLTLDNGSEERVFGADVREQLTSVLDLFGRQVAAALERARLNHEYRLISDIHRTVSTRAAEGNLDTLLDEVREQVKQLMDITNFMVALADLETESVDYRRQYEGGVLQERDWRGMDACLSGYVITHGQPVLTDDTDEFRNQHGIRLCETPAKCWLGVPLDVEGKSVGALIVQSYQNRAAYNERHQRLLSMVADQVAGAIYLAYKLERKAELQRQDKALELLKLRASNLIKESEDLFWHAVLTVATHKDGYSFNRSALFWYDRSGEYILGRMGIGYFTRKEAHQAWEKDREDGQSLQDYFAAPHRALLEPTPLQKKIVGIQRALHSSDNPFYKVLTQGQQLICLSNEMQGYLPDEMLFPPDLRNGTSVYPCALIPIRTEKDVLGALVVDNAFDGEPLRPSDLGRLEYMLNESIQIWQQTQETRRIQQMGERYERTLALQSSITAKALDRPLHESLKELCEISKNLTGADAVVVYPYRANTGSYELKFVSHVGLMRPEDFNAKEKPRQQGVTFTVLQSGTLVVPDVSNSELFFGGRSLDEHSFLQREKIKALIGAPMRSASTGEPLGVIYLDYRSPRKFDPKDIALAEHIAAIGATVIHTVREVERESLGRTSAERSEQQRRRDMQLLSNIQMQALSSDTDEKKAIRSILQNAAELFERTATVTLSLLNWIVKEDDSRTNIRLDYSLTEEGVLDVEKNNPNQGLIGRAFEQLDSLLDGNTIVCPIWRGERPIGFIQLKRALPEDNFEKEYLEIVERLATVAALVLDNVRVRKHLETVAETVGAVSSPIGLKETLAKVVAAARKVAPDIDCVTLWYVDGEDEKRLLPGPQWGVKKDRHRRNNASTNNLVQRIMKRQEPLFSLVAAWESSLKGEFIRDENIVSVAAFPLRFGKDKQALGALFLNYREAHEFTPIERTLFKIFADAATTAIHDAQSLELAKRGKDRLEAANKIATKVGATLDMDVVLEEILEILCTEFARQHHKDDASSSESCPQVEISPYIMLYDDRDKILELPSVAQKFYQPDKREYQPRMRLSLYGTGITPRTARQALDEEKIVVINVRDVKKDLDYVETNASTRSEMCAGLVNGGKLFGVLVVKSHRVNAFDEGDEKFFEMAAHQVAIVLERVEAAKQHVSDARKLAYLAWRAEISHRLSGHLALLRSVLDWFESYLNNTSAPFMEAQSISELISNNLSELDKMMSSQSPTPKPLKLSVLIDQLRKFVENKKEQTGWENKSFEWPTLEQDITLFCYPDRLRASIENIIFNALEATEEFGHIGIKIHKMTTNSDSVEIEIWDDGPGFPEEIYSRKENEIYSTKSNKRGLGLHNARIFLEAMGGKLELLRPDPPAGAHVLLQIPLVKDSNLGEG